MDYKKDDEIDLIALLKTVFTARRFVLKPPYCLLFSALFALISPVKYTASSTFVPQLSEGRSSSSLGGLASLAGINLSAIMGGQPQEISPSFTRKSLKAFPIDFHF